MAALVQASLIVALGMIFYCLGLIDGEKQAAEKADKETDDD